MGFAATFGHPRSESDEELVFSRHGTTPGWLVQLCAKHLNCLQQQAGNRGHQFPQVPDDRHPAGGFPIHHE